MFSFCWRNFTPHIFESKAKNHEKQFIVKFRQSLRKYDSLKIVPLLLFAFTIHKDLKMNEV